MKDVITFRHNHVEEGILRIELLQHGDPLADLGKRGVAHCDNRVDPKKVRVQADGFFRQASTFAVIPKTHGAEGYPLRIVLVLSRRAISRKLDWSSDGLKWNTQCHGASES